MGDTPTPEEVEIDTIEHLMESAAVKVLAAREAGLTVRANRHAQEVLRLKDLRSAILERQALAANLE